MAKKLTEKVTWVGKTDWELKKFHGDEYTTRKGSSYNSYLIRDEKTLLIDTAWLPFDQEFVKNLKEEMDLSGIDAIIALHGEVDHSGALMELMKEIPNVPIYCTANGIQSIQGQYHQNWNFIPVKTGDQLHLGETTLTFIEAPMLHWPDTMFAYLSKENILFSSDAFGQHMASEHLYAHEVDSCELREEAFKYYANIVGPFSVLANRKIKEVLAMDLPISMICPSHGLIWKENPSQIVEFYLKWSDAYQENQITILYDTMWNDTKKMAELIAQGIQNKDTEVTVKLLNTAKEDKTEILAEVFQSKMILVGSPTVNNGYLYSIAGILEMIKGLKLKNKKATAFGSYGWSGEAVQLITKELKEAGFEIIHDGIRCLWTPDEKQEKELIQFGENLIEGR